MSFITRLQHHLKLVNTNIDNVNYGGCAYVAVMATQWLKQTHNVTASITYVLDDEDLEDIQSNMVHSCRHAYVQIGSIYYDSTGEHTLESILEKWDAQDYHILPISDDKALTTLQAVDLWNPSFNRLHGPKQIAKIFKGQFNLIEGFQHDTRIQR